MNKPKVTVREAQQAAEIRRLERLNTDMAKRHRQRDRDLQDCLNAAQTIFARCACGRMRERGIICPTNQEGGTCEAGS
jgi:hypothetical protein